MNSNRTLSIEAVLRDGKGAASRLLCDIERFDLGLLELQWNASGDGNAVVRMVLDTNHSLEPCHIRARFARHPCVLSVRVVASEPGADAA